MNAAFLMIIGVQYRNKAMCLICYETVVVFRKFNIKRNYESKHQNKYVNFKGNPKTSLLEKFKQIFKSERVGNSFEKHNRGNDEIIQASYEVANLIARENEKFENRFQDFKSQMTSFRLIENNVHETVQLELFDLKKNNHLKDLYKDITDKNTDLKINFYKTLTDDFPKIKELSMRIFTLFGSTYIYEQTFLRINYVKYSERSRLTDEHLHYLLIKNWHSERSDECIDFTMIITSQNNAPISNYGGGFRCKSEYPWCIIQIKS
ncbi:general transcription factor II-I repeat domain-containing protein 2-like [Aphis craccivora]|uniref:General transcription factor II-I repeat domain-containing protein 2-like n=1 Tax=Aphis craccivora TaxID=307492 RepID=A0A6G0W0T5_APHCR|nr:general transcription factor II-I repeat domain-containing protein 2-like [Aphis craccivora]